MLHWLWVVIIGLIIGAIAKLIMPGKDPGSLLATWIGRALGWYAEGQSAGFIMSVLGAVVLLAIYHFARRKPA